MKSLSRRKAAAYLGFATNTLKSYETKGIGPTHTRIANTVRYSVVDLDAWREAHKVGGAQ